MLGRGISRSLAAMAMLAGVGGAGSAPVAAVDSPSSRGRVRNPFIEPGESRSERRKSSRFSRKGTVTDVSGVSLKGVPRFEKPLRWLKEHADYVTCQAAHRAARCGDGKHVQQMARSYYAMLQAK